MTFDEWIDWRIASIEKDEPGQFDISEMLLDTLKQGKDKENHEARKLLMSECAEQFSRMLAREDIRMSHQKFVERWISDNVDELDLD